MLETIELETAPNPVATVIWMHGLGSDGNDFVPIVNELDHALDELEILNERINSYHAVLEPVRRDVVSLIFRAEPVVPSGVGLLIIIKKKQPSSCGCTRQTHRPGCRKTTIAAFSSKCKPSSFVVFF